MESVITRDTDIIREYLAALDARERGLSPFAKLASTVKLARLRRHLDAVHLETTDEDIAALRREVDGRLDRSLARRLLARRWAARLALFLIVVLGQQLILALLLIPTALFVKFAPRPSWWVAVLPREEPVFLILFILLFFFSTPMLALAVLFGGRYFRSWRVTLPAAIVIFALSALGTYLVSRNKWNPVQHPTSSSLHLFAKERGVNVKPYREWVAANWLLNDAGFQRDYEAYLRKGPGRWITSGLKDDASWAGSLAVMSEYLDSGYDPDGLRQWLTDYLSRNRVYSDERITQEVNALTGEANHRFLGIWQLEPFLKERDQRLYRAYLGSIDSGMKRWGLVGLLVLAVVLIGLYLTGPLLSLLDRGLSRVSRAKRSRSFEPDVLDPRDVRTGRIAQLKERYYSFPERDDITTPPFFETPFKVLSSAHRSYMAFAVSSLLLVLVFWAAIYGVQLAGGARNPGSQLEMMRSNLLFFGPSSEQDQLPAASPSMVGAAGRDLQQMLEDADYEVSKRLKQQSRAILNQRSDLDRLRSLSSQLQDTTSGLPTQVAELSTRATAAEARAGELIGEASTAKQKAETVERQLTAKIGDVENRAARVSDQVGRVEDQTSALATRTEALEKELDRRAREVEARTEELGERTAGLKEREEQFDRLHRVALAAIMANLTADVGEFDRRTQSAFYRYVNKGDAQRDAESLRQRITQLKSLLSEAPTDEVKQHAQQVDELGKRLDQIASRLK